MCGYLFDVDEGSMCGNCAKRNNLPMGGIFIVLKFLVKLVIINIVLDNVNESHY